MVFVMSKEEEKAEQEKESALKLDSVPPVMFEKMEKAEQGEDGTNLRSLLFGVSERRSKAQQGKERELRLNSLSFEAPRRESKAATH